MTRRKNKGQSLLEYTILLTIILGAFLAVGNYFKRGLQGKWKSSVDSLGVQYDPRTAKTDVKHVLRSDVDTRILVINGTTGEKETYRDDVTVTTETKTGYSSVGEY